MWEKNLPHQPKASPHVTANKYSSEPANKTPNPKNDLRPKLAPKLQAKISWSRRGEPLLVDPVQNPEWTKSRIGQNPEWTKSRMDKIQNLEKVRINSVLTAGL